MIDITQTDRDLILRAQAACNIGVSLGQFAQTNGMSYRELTDLLEKHGVRIEKRVRLVLPTELAA